MKLVVFLILLVALIGVIVSSQSSDVIEDGSTLDAFVENDKKSDLATAEQYYGRRYYGRHYYRPYYFRRPYYRYRRRYYG